MSHQNSKTISLDEARARLLRAHFALPSKKASLVGVTAAREWIKHLAWVQIDTIHVIERAHHHILFSRLPDFRPAMFDALQSEHRAVFEYWTHALCYLPIESFRYALPMMRAYQTGKRKWWRPVSKAEIASVRQRLKEEGALDLSAFEANPKAVKRHAWASKKPSKAALEWLFFAGEVMISRRQGMRKFYDLTERVLPSNIDVSYPSELEIGNFWIEAALASQVFLTEKEIGYQKNDYRRAISRALEAGVESKTLEKVSIEGSKEVYYSKARTFESSLASTKTETGRTRILNPFDPLVIQRNRLKRLFDFSYTIECYVPEAKRKLGYFALPILYEDRFVGVVDLKADREANELRVQAFHLQHPERISKKLDFKKSFNEALSEMLEFQGVTRVRQPK